MAAFHGAAARVSSQPNLIPWGYERTINQQRKQLAIINEKISRLQAVIKKFPTVVERVRPADLKNTTNRNLQGSQLDITVISQNKVGILKELETILKVKFAGMKIALEAACNNPMFSFIQVDGLKVIEAPEETPEKILEAIEMKEKKLEKSRRERLEHCHLTTEPSKAIHKQHRSVIAPIEGLMIHGAAKKLKGMSTSHTENRLKLFREVCKTIEYNKDRKELGLQSSIFIPYVKAECIGTQKGLLRNDFQNAHVSILPSLSFQPPGGEMKVLRGHIKFKKNYVDLKGALNTTDYLPSCINIVDSLIENLLRPTATALLSEIVRPGCRATHAQSHDLLAMHIKEILMIMGQTIHNSPNAEVGSNLIKTLGKYERAIFPVGTDPKYKQFYYDAIEQLQVFVNRIERRKSFDNKMRLMIAIDGMIDGCNNRMKKCRHN